MLFSPSRVGMAVSWFFFHRPGFLFDIDLILEAKSGIAGSWENEWPGTAGIIFDMFGFLISLILVNWLLIKNVRTWYYFKDQGLYSLVSIGISYCPGNQVIAQWQADGGAE